MQSTTPSAARETPPALSSSPLSDARERRILAKSLMAFVGASFYCGFSPPDWIPYLGTVDDQLICMAAGYYIRSVGLF